MKKIPTSFPSRILSGSIMFTKMTLREIKNSLGRYLAIFAIVALGVGFFAGLKVSKEAMVKTADEYLKKQNLFDYNLISTLGFTDEDVEEIKSIDTIGEAEGTKESDFIYLGSDKVEKVLKAISLPKNINKVSLIEGRMPENPGECLVDKRGFTRADIGSQIKIASVNSKETIDSFSVNKFEIVGIVTSPLYLNYERGSTKIGSGSISSFIYTPVESFTAKEYTGIYATLDKYNPIYSRAYEKYRDKTAPEVSDKLDEVANKRYNRLKEEISEAKEKYAVAQLMGLPVEPMDLPEPEKPATYNLERNTNPGYMAFESDSDIVNGIAKVFPAFFFLVAALVCMTTMARMVDEKRIEIGVLKALGYGNNAVLSKYLFYAGSAAFLGAVIGFVGGSYLFPRVIWNAYGIMYDFNNNIEFIFDKVMGIGCILVALAGSMGATWFSCESDFRIVPAQLIRPKSPKNGKRILLERIPFIWEKLSFLYKVSCRNIFRYKKRFFMMIMGISGCTALVLTGFGINDSIKNIAAFQFDEIMLYDYSVSFQSDMASGKGEFLDSVKSHVDKAAFIHEASVDVISKKKHEEVKLIVSDGEDFKSFIDFHNSKGEIKFPDKGKAVICEKLAETFNYKVGDTIKLKDSEHKDLSVEIAGICQNYVYNYVYISEATYESGFGHKPELKTALVNVRGIGEDERLTDDEIEDKIHKSAAKTMENDEVLGTLVNVDMLNRISKMMGSLDSVVALVIFSAGALAFIVLYNLTNINITERVREIATIKVLGFYPVETALYVFRENFFLTLMGAGAGLGLGKLLHAFVMTRIKVDLIYFQIRISPWSYLAAVAITLAFAGFVNFIFYFKLKRISMTESLKAVE